MPRRDDTRLPDNVEMIDKEKAREAREERIGHMICDHFKLDRANWRAHRALVCDLIVAFDGGGQPPPTPPPPPPPPDEAGTG